MNEGSGGLAGRAGELMTARMIASHVKARWEQGERVDALAALVRHPDLARHKSVVLDLAYEEFCQRLEAPDPVSIETFCENFPSCRESLQRLLQVHQLMHRDPAFLALRQPAKWPEPGDNVLGFDLEEEIGRGAFAAGLSRAERAPRKSPSGNQSHLRRSCRS